MKTLLSFIVFLIFFGQGFAFAQVSVDTSSNSFEDNPTINWAYSVVVFPCQFGRMSEYTVNSYELKSRKMYRYMLRVNLAHAMIKKIAISLKAVIGDRVYVAPSRWINGKRFCFVNGVRINSFEDLKRAMLSLKNRVGMAPLLLTVSYILDLKKGNYDFANSAGNVSTIQGTEIKIQIRYRFFASEDLQQWRTDSGRYFVKSQSRARIVIKKFDWFSILDSLKKGVVYFITVPDKNKYSVLSHMKALMRAILRMRPRYAAMRCNTLRECPKADLGYYYRCEKRNSNEKVKHCRYFRQPDVVEPSRNVCKQDKHCKLIEKCTGSGGSEFCKVRDCDTKQSFCYDDSTQMYCIGDHTWKQRDCSEGCVNGACKEKSKFKEGQLRCGYAFINNMAAEYFQRYSLKYKKWIAIKRCRYGCGAKRCNEPKPVKCNILGLKQCIKIEGEYFIQECKKGFWKNIDKCSKGCNKKQGYCKSAKVYGDYSLSLDIGVGACHFQDLKNGRLLPICGAYSIVFNVMLPHVILSLRGDYYHGAANNWSPGTMQHAGLIAFNFEHEPLFLPIGWGIGAGYFNYPVLIGSGYRQYTLSGFTTYLFLNLLFSFDRNTWHRTNVFYMHTRLQFSFPVQTYPVGQFRDSFFRKNPFFGVVVQIGYRTPRWF